MTLFFQAFIIYARGFLQKELHSKKCIYSNIALGSVTPGTSLSSNSRLHELSTQQSEL